MASRTYTALGLGWATWISLQGDEKGPVILTSSKNGQPHAYLESPAEAQRVFGVTRGGPIDNLPGSEQHRAFIQSFPDDTLARIKVESQAFYADAFAEADKADTSEDTTRRTEIVEDAQPKAKRAKKTA